MSEEELNEQQVTLKPVLGIHPEKYIRIIYLILALFLFFLVFFLPGIMKNGTYYTISTTPGGASVYADGIRLGASPGKYFIEKGKRTITVKSPYHETWESEVKVKGRTFGTLFLKRNRDMAIEMVSNITPDFISEHHLLTASWFQSDEGFSSLQLPPHMQDLFKAYYRSSNRNSRLDDNLLEDYLASLLRTAAYDNSYYQWLEAFALFETKGKALNSSNLLTAAANAAAFVAENPELLNLLTEFHDVSGVSAAAAARSERLNFDIEGEEIQLIPSDPLKFIPVASLYSSDENWTYYIADREITKGWYLRFLEDNPRWSLPEKDKLIDAGLVDDNYLLDWEDNQLTYESQEPLRYISWHAAEAFNKWLNTSYFNSSDIKVRLPEEWEWEETAGKNGLTSRDRPSQKNLGALEAGSFLPGALNLYDMEGNLWEWCSNGFGTNDPYLYNSLSATDSFPFPDKAVRGGSWANPPGQVKPENRGSQPADWCTAYIGFRPVVLQKR